MEITDGYVTEALEKRVISEDASAGTYFFRDAVTFLCAMEENMKFNLLYGSNDNLFLCPMFNGIIRSGRKVYPVKITNVNEISLKFKNENS